MTRHDTPEEVAKLLARYAPKDVARLLDPCTGKGVLVKPFLSANSKLHVLCIDIDPKMTSLVKSTFQEFGGVSVTTADFLEWSAQNKVEPAFDCVVMNPPFAARKEQMVKVKVVQESTEPIEVFAPTEIAFIYQSVPFLRPGGRLLAIVPASVVATETGRLLRNLLINSGAIKLVHELPPRTFSGVEGRMYLLVYEHGVRQGSMALRNHRLQDPDELKLPVQQVHETQRFDYAYHDARRRYEAYRSLADLGWVALQDIAETWRGEVSSPIRESTVLHTTNFFDFQTAEQFATAWKRPVRYGDIVCKRVARNCAESFIPYYRRKPARVSDCILILRPNQKIGRLELLFALRSVVASRRGAPLIENGVGATYISSRALKSLKIPLGLASRYPATFSRFKDAVFCRRWEQLPELEQELQRSLRKRCATLQT